MRRCLTVCLLLLSTTAFAQTTQFYAPNGSPAFTERCEMNGKWLVTRDNRGQMVDYWVYLSDGWAEKHDKTGRVIARKKGAVNNC